MEIKQKIVIGDDQRLFRKWLKMTIAGESDFVVVGEAEDGLEVINQIFDLNPDIVIIDYEMPNLNGLEAAKKILKDNPKQKIVMMTVHKDLKIVEKARKIGVKGFLLKDSEEDEIISVLRLIAKGKTYYSSEVSGTNK